MWGKADNFFVITSENVCQIKKSHLFGFFIAKNKCYKNCDLDNTDETIIENGGHGLYIYLKKNGSDIQVFWDDTGSICLYVYEDCDYWAFSNSFWLLCDEVTREHQITLDERFAMHYINVTLASLSVRNTLAKEIKVVPLHSVISIKGIKLSIKSKPVQKEFFCCPIDSEEALSIIDEWIEDWTQLIHTIAGSGYSIGVDLTGGFDSRVSFSLAMASRIDLNAKNVCVLSHEPVTPGEIYRHTEDYDIAGKICRYYGIELNKDVKGITKSLTGKQAFDLSWHSFLGFHKEAYFSSLYNVVPRFGIPGSFGEPVRGKIRDFDRWFGMCDCIGARNSAVFSYLELADSINEVERRNELNDKYTTLVNLYINTWNRYHFGLAAFKKSCRNEYILAPLSDRRLLRISVDKGDKDLIYAVIMMRTCPEILKFPFARGENFSAETLNMAEQINSRKRLNLHITDSKIDLDSLGDAGFEEVPCETSTDASEILERLFKDEKNQKNFLDRFGVVGEEIYHKMWDKYRNTPLLYPESMLVPIVAVMRMIQYEKDSSAYNNHRVLYKQQSVILEELIEKYPDSKRLKIKNGIYVQKMLEQRGIKTVAIYGAGERGKQVCDDLKWGNIEIIFAVDKNPKAILPGIRMVSIDEKFPQVDAMIVTPYGYFEEIKKILLKKDKTLKLIDLEELIE